MHYLPRMHANFAFRDAELTEMLIETFNPGIADRECLYSKSILRIGSMRFLLLLKDITSNSLSRSKLGTNL